MAGTITLVQTGKFLVLHMALVARDHRLPSRRRRRRRRTTIALQDRLRHSKRRNDLHPGQRKPSRMLRLRRRDPLKHSALHNLHLIPRRIQMRAARMEVRSSRIVAMRSRKTADLDSLTNVDPAALGRVFFEIWASLDSQTSELNANARARPDPH
jgi:hypothetical protein